MLFIRVLLLWCLVVNPAAAGWFAEIGGNVQHRTGASDWVLVDGSGTYREYVGQVTAVVGYERGGLSVFGGFSHLSLPGYGHDRGLNSQMIGVSYRWRL